MAEDNNAMVVEPLRLLIPGITATLCRPWVLAFEGRWVRPLCEPEHRADLSSITGAAWAPGLIVCPRPQCLVRLLNLRGARLQYDCDSCWRPMRHAGMLHVFDVVEPRYELRVITAWCSMCASVVSPDNPGPTMAQVWPQEVGRW